MDKMVSHKGTKGRHEATKKNSKELKGSSLRLRVFPLCLCVKLLLASILVFVALPALAQKNAARFDPDGTFWILSNTPPEFSEFGAINLNAKRSRQLPVQGLEVNNGKRLRFKTLTVKRDNFTFTTVELGGVSYAFSGKFLKGGVYYSGDLDDTIPVLEGTLTKFRHSQKVAEAKLTFSYFGGT
jgi:hypothetical protein